MLYLLACVDDNVLLSNNKKELFDVSWDYVQKILSNSGQVCQHYKVIRKYIEAQGMSEHFLQYMKFHLENAEPSKVIDSSSSVIIFEYLVSAYKIAEFLFPFQITEIAPKVLYNPDSAYNQPRNELILRPITMDVVSTSDI